MAVICPKCGRLMDDKNDTGGHICYEMNKPARIKKLQAENKQLRSRAKSALQHLATGEVGIAEERLEQILKEP